MRGLPRLHKLFFRKQSKWDRIAETSTFDFKKTMLKNNIGTLPVFTLEIGQSGAYRSTLVYAE